MKKKSLKIVCALFLSVLATAFFYSCDKDTDCYVHVTTIDAQSKQPLSDTYVSLIQGERTYVTKQTDANGECTLSLHAPALMNVVAKYEKVLENNTSGKFYYHMGENAVRLIDGETKEVTIEIDRTTDPLSQNDRPQLSE
ncbi:MAG: hypothetical protein K5650_04175 [Bacteroidales bacterium]|nr:hypothetical protein [Bacteroidales bacterium]